MASAATKGNDYKTQHEETIKNLEDARTEASQKGLDSQAMVDRIRDEFTRRFRKQPYDWQLEVTEALILRLDCVVIAGTGCGKTIPFMMPLLADPEKKAIIISPLKVLQQDQVYRFKKMDISAVAVNGETWSTRLKEALEAGAYQAIFTSPEMCLKHNAFRAYLNSALLSQEIAMVVVDEAHCISQWGGEFRKEYSELGRLRSFFPVDTPILATSATLPPASLADIQGQLKLNVDSGYILNLGNDRPNIKMSVRKIKSTTDYNAVLPLLTYDGTTPTGLCDLMKTIIFINSVPGTQICAKKIREHFPPGLREYVDVLHSLRTPRSKRRVMKEFRRSGIQILVATEAAGMGADIPDIERVIQVGAPDSLSVWVQRAGRAGRSADIKASAILLIEESVFKSRRKKKGTNSPSGMGIDEGGEESGDDSEEEEGELAIAQCQEPGAGEDTVWMKKVDADLRRWLQSDDCRRDVLDGFFGVRTRY